MMPARALNWLCLTAVIGALGLLWSNAISARTFDILFALAMGNTVFALLPRVGIGERTVWIAATAFTVAAIAAVFVFPYIRLAPYLAIALINGFVAYAFGHGLSTGREPVVLQIIRISRSGPDASDGFRRYVISQCRIWTVFGLVTMSASLIAMISADSRAFLDPVLAVLFIVQIGWFILSHAYAQRTYRRPETALITIRAMSSPEIWSALKI